MAKRRAPYSYDETVTKLSQCVKKGMNARLLLARFWDFYRLGNGKLTDLPIRHQLWFMEESRHFHGHPLHDSTPIPRQALPDTPAPPALHGRVLAPVQYRKIKRSKERQRPRATQATRRDTKEMKRRNTRAVRVRPGPKKKGKRDPSAFVLSNQCKHCDALIDSSEKRLCCKGGACLISHETLPFLSAEFIALLNSVRDLGDVSRELNNSTSFSALGTEHLAERGFEYRLNNGAHGPTMYFLNGRTYHRFFGPTSADASAPGLYCTQHPPSKYLHMDVVDTFREFFSTTNCLGMELKYIDDLATREYYLSIHEDDRPLNDQEHFAIEGTPSGWLVPPRICGVALPLLGGKPVTISPLTALYDTAQYPLLFPSGEGGWSMEARYASGSKVTSVADFVKYCLYQATGTFVRLHSCSQQYWLDQFSRWQDISFNRMSNVPQLKNSHQKRVARFKDLAERHQGKKDIGRPLLIPPSVPGSPAHQRREIRNGLSVYAKMGNPHLFITFTGNPAWDDFHDAVRIFVGTEVERGEITPAKYPDIFIRVFRKKLAQLEKDLADGKIFGKQVFVQRVVEFQKRGIPHAHIALRVAGVGVLTPEVVDSWITTRKFFHEDCPLFPGFFNTSPNDLDHAIWECLRSTCDCEAHVLSRTVVRLMRHQRCDARCLVRGKCRRGYPKVAGVAESKKTWLDQKGFWVVKRMFHHDKDVVPYNKDLVLRYNAHINVEVSGSVKVITYLKKYMTKLPDNSRMSLDSRSSLRDELREWQRMRHVGVAEALMRMRHIPLNKSSVGVTVLFVHKPGENMVTFIEDAEDDDAVNGDSQLLRYFKRSSDVLLDNVTFADYYSTYNLVDSLPKKKNRKCFRDTCDVPKYACERCRPHVARIEHFKSDDELQAIRDLLRHRPARSFEDLCTISGVVYGSFVAAAEAFGIRRGNEYASVLQETINPNISLWRQSPMAMDVPFVGCPHQLRRLFVMMAIAGASTKSLYDQFFPYLAIDMPIGSSRHISAEEREKLLLLALSDLLHKERMSLSDVGLPEVDDPRDPIQSERDRYTKTSLKKMTRAFRQLDEKQRDVLLTIERAVLSPSKRSRDGHPRDDRDGQLFFLQGRPGRGKTFVTNILAARLRAKGHIVSVSSPSAKGALHYQGGTTCHKAFGIPIFDADAEHPPQSKMTKNSASAKVLTAASLIVIDEASMLHQKTLDTIDGLLRFLTGNNRLFGGKTILFSGDTGQLSPVTKLPGREAAVAASIVSHPVMARIKVITLSASKRQANDIPFSTFCDSLADGNGQDGAFTIPVPESISITRSHDSALDWFLRDAIPPNAASTCPSSWPLYNSAVVAYTNGYVDFYNDYILNEVAKALQTPLWQSFATEEFAEINGVNLATPDYMESYSEPGTPEHTFKACLGARCTLTRNFLPSRGLVNGAFVMITGRTANTISVRNVTPGPFYGNEDILFRFTFNISVKEMFNFNRKQFPLRLAYAATVHKYQGDTIKGKLLVDCSNPSFTHGQLSVAISRGVASENIALCVSPTDFDNQSIEGLLYRDLLLERRGGKRSKREREH